MSDDFAGLALEVDKPQRMVIMHPTLSRPLVDKDGNEAYIDLYSADSPRAQQHNRELARRRLNQRVRVKQTPEEIEANNTDLYVALTAGWRLLSIDGSPLDLPFTPENARKLYDAPSVRWLRDQVDDFAADRGNFAPPSWRSSLSGPSKSSGKAG